MRMGYQTNLLRICVSFIAALHLIRGELCKYDSDPCKCQANGNVYDMKSLMDNRQGLDFSATGDTDFTYYVQPCNKQLTTMLPACSSKGSTLVSCQVYQSSSLAYGLGVINQYDVTGSPESFTLKNSFTDVDHTDRILQLTIKCADQETSFSYDGHSGVVTPITYSFSILSRHICSGGGGTITVSGGISVGSVMVIIFFVLIVVYIVGGLLFLKFVKKAEGREIIPNLEFWKVIPSLIKDGVLFTFSCCRRNAAYGKI